MRANEYKNELMKVSGMKDWYVIHDEDQSVIYYGYYRAIDDAKDKKEAERRRAIARRSRSWPMPGEQDRCGQHVRGDQHA